MRIRKIAADNSAEIMKYLERKNIGFESNNCETKKKELIL